MSYDFEIFLTYEFELKKTVYPALPNLQILKHTATDLQSR